jgi:signal transduction histidine kinase
VHVVPVDPDLRDEVDLLEAAHALSEAVAALNRDMELHAVYRAVSAGASADPGIVMGWMGLVDAAQQVVKPVAWWGHESGYLKDIRITLDDTAHGRGPAGRAFLTGKPSIVDSIDDPDFSPWRDEAAKRGYLSVVGLPLHDTEDRVFGVLVLYSDRRRHFTPMRTALFQVFARSAGLAVQNALLVQRLETQAQELEQRVQERTRELEARNAEMQEANRQLTESARYKSDFLSNMSHELRSPLTAIMGFSEVLRDELYGPLNAKQKEHSGHIWQAGRHLLDTINDILELSRIESGRTELDVGQCFPRQIFDAAGTMLLQLATTQGAALDWEVDPSAEVPIEADARKLKQAVFNLGSRLVKAAGVGGRVRMKASVEGERLHIDLSWRRADPDGTTPARTPITGFGVTLAQQLVRLHGGDTTFDTPPDAAGRYRLDLPVLTRPAEHANAPSEE